MGAPAMQNLRGNRPFVDSDLRDVPRRVGIGCPIYRLLAVAQDEGRLRLDVDGAGEAEESAVQHVDHLYFATLGVRHQRELAPPRQRSR
jgi:hypothetical protein